MRAVQISSLDGPASLEVVDTAVPIPGDGQVLVQVHAAGVAFPELLQSRGKYQLRPPLPFVPGAEVSGLIVAAAADSGFAPGDRVAAICLLGGFAEYVVAPIDATFRIPDEVSYLAGACIVSNYGTSYFALVERGGLSKGEAVLVQGAAGGVGTAGIQVAKAFGAERVVAITSTPEKGEAAVKAGADEYVLTEGFREAAGRRGKVDIVFDPVGGDRIEDSLRCLKDNGRLLVMGFAGGGIPTVGVNRLLLNNISIVGVGWGAYLTSRPGHIQTEWAALLPHLESGSLRPVISSTHPLEAAAAALIEIEERRSIGKVLLVP